MEPITSHHHTLIDEVQIKSKHRVEKYGEVLTPHHIVSAMLDLVKSESERIDSRFLEPACGNGNFLMEILSRKLKTVEARYAKNQFDFERYAILATSSIYGIDILQDNIQECRQRLFELFRKTYSRIYKNTTKVACLDSAYYLLSKNIVHGDALSLNLIGTQAKPIVLSEWSLFLNSAIKRRDFIFRDLVETNSARDLPLFSDSGEEVFIPKPFRDYPPVHFLELAYVYGDES